MEKTHCLRYSFNGAWWYGTHLQDDRFRSATLEPGWAERLTLSEAQRIAHKLNGEEIGWGNDNGLKPSGQPVLCWEICKAERS